MATFLLILLGGIVHTTGSSLACPDWPLCYGSLVPEMKGGVAIEHTHRLVASGVGLLTVILAFILRQRGSADPWLRRLSIGAVALVIIQGIFGGVTVLFQLPPAVSTTHLAVSMIFFAVTLLLALQMAGIPLAIRSIPLLWITVGLVYLQIVLGAVVRHTGSGLVCLEFPLCYGSLWPSALGFEAKLQMAHRILGFIVAVMVLWTCHRLWRSPEFSGSRLRPLIGAAPVLVILQIALGIVSLETLLGLPAVTAHLGGGALLWAAIIPLEFAKC